MKSTNVVFDGNYLLHKTFSVIRNYNPDAETVEELFKDTKLKGVFLRKMIIDACSALNKITVPIDQVVFVFDSTSWRYGFHPDYKHKLSKVKNDDFTQVFEIMEKLITKLINVGFVVSRVEAMEGDDLLFFWSKYFENLEQDAILVTGDGDMHQLVSEYISVFNNNSKNLNLYTSEPKELLSISNVKLHVVDARYVVFKKILLGDSGDNVPSVKRGFGEKTFDKFYNQMASYIALDCIEEMAHNLNHEFAKFLKTEENFEDKIAFNIRLTYLDHIVYSDPMIESVIETIGQMPYTYKEPKFTLEHIYGMMIK
jgi:5'-3' exonuclease